jgi:hypothetical protein
LWYLHSYCSEAGGLGKSICFIVSIKHQNTSYICERSKTHTCWTFTDLVVLLISEITINQGFMNQDHKKSNYRRGDVLLSVLASSYKHLSLLSLFFFGRVAFYLSQVHFGRLVSIILEWMYTGLLLQFFPITGYV